ncbi:TPA: hypothetical protein U3P29_001382 [Streptococcus agalactiae]|nr:hypothetical protein [Streptococcus agalactiae]
MVKKRYSKNSHNLLTLLGIVVLASLISDFWSEVIATLLIIGGGYCAYYVYDKKRLKRFTSNQRIEALKSNIKETDQDIRHLEILKKDNLSKEYIKLANQILPQLDLIRNEANQLQKAIEPNIYKRITKKANTFSNEINEQLIKLHASPELEPISDQEDEMIRIAPELKPFYHNIQDDHYAILKKIEKADNKAELAAIHQANMKRFTDVLAGYIRIKQSPKNFNNAKERLEQALQAIKKFNLDLDETLRQLNESDMKDFDVSLRMMQDERNNK